MQRMSSCSGRIEQQLPLILRDMAFACLEARLILRPFPTGTFHREIPTPIDSPAVCPRKPQHNGPAVLALHVETGPVRLLQHGDPIVPSVCEPDEPLCVRTYGDRQRRLYRRRQGHARALFDLDTPNGFIACQPRVVALKAVVYKEVAMEAAVACWLSLSCRVRAAERKVAYQKTGG